MDTSKLTVDEILAVIRTSQKALKQTDALLSKVARAGIKAPEAFVSMVEPTMRLRERIQDEFDTLQQAFNAAFRS